MKKKNMKPKVSIIIRTKNEEKWIASCLKAVFSQSFRSFEVIVVDNQSTDKTVQKAKAFDVKIVKIKSFRPGKAINAGIRKSIGEIVVILSGHCIPTNNKWLQNLIRDVEKKDVAGVYGRQEPLSFSSDADKRDLALLFGLDKKIQRKDPFFHNANSAIKRKLWEKIPFDEKVTNIEDRVWAKEVLSKGYKIVYEPKASVLHYHGVHQNGNTERCRNVTRILESLSEKSSLKTILDVNKLNIFGIIPIRGEVLYCGDKPLLEITIKQALESEYLDNVIVSTDSPELAKIARKAGAVVPFMRPSELSLEYVDIHMVMQYTLEQLEKLKIYPDLVVMLEATYPFRPAGFIDQLIMKLVQGGFDSIVPVKPEHRSAWVKNQEKAETLGQEFVPRKFKDYQLYISLLGLGLCTYPTFIREGSMTGDKVGFVEVADPYCHIEVRDSQTVDIASKILDRGNQEKIWKR